MKDRDYEATGSENRVKGRRFQQVRTLNILGLDTKNGVGECRMSSQKLFSMYGRNELMIKKSIWLGCRNWIS